MKQVIGIGSPLLDILTRVSDEFLSTITQEKGGMELVEFEEIESIINKLDTDFSHAPGGATANTILGLANLGVPSTFLGKLGSDQHAKAYLEQLRQHHWGRIDIETLDGTRAAELQAENLLDTTGLISLSVVPDSDTAITFKTIDRPSNLPLAIVGGVLLLGAIAWTAYDLVGG